MPAPFTKNVNWLAVLRRVWAYKFFGEDPTGIGNNTICLNSSTYPGEYATGMNAAGTSDVNMIGIDGSNNVVFPSPSVFQNSVTIPNLTITELNGQFVGPPMLKTVTYNETLNASVGTTPFFIAEQAYTVLGISWVAKTACTGTGTATVTKDTGTAAPGAGTSLLTGTFDTTTTANTVLNGTLTATTAALTMAAGDRLAILFAGTLTSLAGVVVTVQLQPTTASETAQVFWRANGDIATQSFFQANRDMVVTGVKAVYGTAFGAAITINVMKDTSTTAAGGGTSVLAAAMAGDGAINTVLSPALTATASVLSMKAGDRLSLKFSATTTGALLAVTVTFQPIYARKELTWQLAPNAQQQVAQCFFIADRAYEVVDASCIFDVAAGGAAKIGVTIDKGTTVPGGGNVVQTDNTNAGFDLNAAARTSQFMTPASLHLRLLSPGDRLGLVVTGAAQSIADVCITVSLRPNY